MSKTCVRHKEVPAATMCHQCHSPICTPCSIVTPHGTFCSPECGILFRDFKERQGREKDDTSYSKMTTIIKLVVAVLLMGLGFIGINQAAARATLNTVMVRRLKEIKDSGKDPMDLVSLPSDGPLPDEGAYREKST